MSTGMGDYSLKLFLSLEHKEATRLLGRGLSWSTCCSVSTFRRSANVWLLLIIGPVSYFSIFIQNFGIRFAIQV